MNEHGRADKDEGHGATQTAARSEHTVQVRDHQLTVDEPIELGGDDTGPDPQELLAVSLASCTAITMEMYAARKGWDIGHVEVDVEYTPRRAWLPDEVRARAAPRRPTCPTSRSSACA